MAEAGVQFFSPPPAYYTEVGLCRIVRLFYVLCFTLTCPVAAGGKTAGNRRSGTQPPVAGAARHPPGH